MTAGKGGGGERGVRKGRIKKRRGINSYMLI